MEVFFEDMVDGIYELYMDLFKKTFPLKEDNRKLWSEPDHLTWWAIGYEQEHFYFNYACGEYEKEHKYMENADEFMSDFQENADEMREKFFYPAEPPEGMDEEMEDRYYFFYHALGESMLTIVMGMVLKKIKDNFDDLPVPVAEKCIMNTFDDIETGRLKALAPQVPVDMENEELVEMLDGIYCRSEENRNLIIAVWRHGRYMNLDDIIKAFFSSPDTIPGLADEKESRMLKILNEEVEPESKLEDIEAKRLLMTNRINLEQLA